MVVVRLKRSAFVGCLLLVRQQDPLDSTPDRLGNLLRMETLRAVEVPVVHTMKTCSPVLQ